MRFRLWMRVVLVCLLVIQELMPTHEQVALTLISGDDTEAAKQAEDLIKRANEIGDFKVKWKQRTGVKRLIAIYDGRFAGRADGRRSILPVVEKIGAQQSIAFYRRKDSKLEIDDLLEISNCLPWDSRLFPKNVEFFTDFENPIELSTFGCVIADEPWVLGFAESIAQQVGPIQYVASTSLRIKNDKQISRFIVLGIEEQNAQKLHTFELDFPESSQPVKTLVLGSKLVCLFNSKRMDDATEYLNNWLIKLEQKKVSSTGK